MDAREQRGLLIASNSRIVKKGAIWLVPSQTGNGRKYTVDPDNATCSCPDHQEGGHRCKHLFAVEFRMTRRIEELDGTIHESTVTVRAEKRTTYAQPNWSAYHESQVNESRHFPALLADLCAMLPETPRKPGRGRKPVSYQDGLFAATMKVFSMVSARRFVSDLEDAKERGYISRLPHFNSVLNVFDSADVTPLLRSMVQTSALPLREIETAFAVDSTGFSGNAYHRWFDRKYGELRQEQKWVKAHFTVGVKTNVVTTVEVLGEDSADCPQLPQLIQETATNFQVAEVTADKAYASRRNFEAVESHGAAFYPMFRTGITGNSRHAGESFRKTFHLFSLHREEYLQHYHQRSNVESAVSMIKRKFGPNLRSKNETSMRNEAYAKFVCHNLSVLIQEMYMLGIDPTFGRCTNLDEPAHILRLPQA